MRGALAAAAALALSPAIATAVAVERIIVVPAPGRVALTLDAVVYEGAREDLGDLRVLDTAGTEVPYLVERAFDESVRPEQRPRIVNRAFQRRQLPAAGEGRGAGAGRSALGDAHGFRLRLRRARSGLRAL